eukprot:scaffold625_cov420-Prasinococcus_capsulatus_cf.AAC.62
MPAIGALAAGLLSLSLAALGQRAPRDLNLNRIARAAWQAAAAAEPGGRGGAADPVATGTDLGGDRPEIEALGL